MKRFLLSLTLFTILITGLNLCWLKFAPETRQIPMNWAMILFFAAVTLLFHSISINASKGKPQAFIRFYMGSTAVRLMMYMFIIIAYRFYDKSTLIPFALGFMAHYFLFTLFEVPLLLQELRKDQGE
jgi:hypothetical protein